MSSILEKLTADVVQWQDSALQNGWLTQNNIAQLAAPQANTPASLFDAVERPLVVAFFGGTGVGKSTLLNRLAGSKIARTSAERPTSREITLYHHESITIKRLPSEFPVDKINQATHNNSHHKSVLWIDMPDFDSAETANRDLVNDWLSHIDLLIYVVSPERYRDDQGWRLLLEHGQRHAWVFVINHWDRGSAGQREAFSTIINEAGLSDPLLFCTDCGPYPDKPNGDEFSEFDACIQDMSSRLIVQQLEEQGVFVKIQETRLQIESNKALLGDDHALQMLGDVWISEWQTTSSEITDSLEWKYKELAKPYAELDRGMFQTFFATVIRALRNRKGDSLQVQGSTGSPDLTAQVDSNELIEEATLTRIAVSLDQLPQAAPDNDLPVQPLRNAISPLKGELAERFKADVKSSLGQSLALPGTELQRNTCRVLGILCTVLPLLALGWAIFKLLNSYADPSSSYLGFNFATHSAMLVGLGWFLPWLLKQHLKPTQRAAAIRGMRNGVKAALSGIKQSVLDNLESLGKQRLELLHSADALFIDTPRRSALSNSSSGLGSGSEQGPETDSEQNAQKASAILDRVLISESNS